VPITVRRLSEALFAFNSEWCKGAVHDPTRLVNIHISRSHQYRSTSLRQNLGTIRGNTSIFYSEGREFLIYGMSRDQKMDTGWCRLFSVHKKMVDACTEDNGIRNKQASVV
jgi:hypothetical protein